MRNPVDIIVPIYNAYSDLVQCIRSIKKYTDLSWDRLILINDCSTDERIAPYLESLKEENIYVFHNESNQGFSGNVNLGMKYSNDRDVILLNSDTIVTKNWIEKLVACAYSADEIGTVTPLSNSATLCSVPIMCKDNSLPENITIDEFADLIEKCSLKKYPRITVAVGFCMFIKRNVIEEIGLFDAETFKRGYGEENDFCNRAELMGYIHVMCDDTFIYHRGTASFVPEDKYNLMQDHQRILEERYPIQMQRNHMYCMNNPEQYIRDNINLYLDLKNGKKNVLYLLQSDFRKDAENNVGGTQFHVKDLVAGMQKQYNIFVLARVGTKLRLSIYNEENVVKTLEFDIGEKLVYPVFRNKRQFDIYDNILKAFSIDLVHIHHILGLSFDIFYAAKKQQIPIYMSLHDYYCVCPISTLINDKKEYCDACQNYEKCKKCLDNIKSISTTVDFMPKWRNEFGKVLDICEKIFTPSFATRDIVLSVYPKVAEKINVIYHGYELEEPKEENIIKQRDIHVVNNLIVHWDYIMNYPNDKNNVVGWAFLEGKESTETKIYIEIKDKNDKYYYLETTTIQRNDVAKSFHNQFYEYCGFKTKIFEQLYPEGNMKIKIILKSEGKYYTDGQVIEIENENKKITSKKMNVAFVGGMVPEKGSTCAYEMIKGEKDKINWFVFGDICDSDLGELQQENFFKVGGYVRNELKELFEAYQIDVVCILSICPETFCYTISEALACGIPVLTRDIGALGERMRKNQCGWVERREAQPEDFLKRLVFLIEHPEEYREKKERAVAYKDKTIEEMVLEYQNHYREIKKKGIQKTFCPEEIFKAIQR